MEWFRMYASYRNNRKTHSLSPEVRCAHIDLMCLACERDDAGYIFDVSDAAQSMAWELRISIEKAEELLDKLVDAGLVNEEDGLYIIHDYKEMQKSSDSSTERVRKHRAKQRVTNNETLQKRYSNGERERESRESRLDKKELHAVSNALDIDVVEQKYNLLDGHKEFYDAYGCKKNLSDSEKAWIQTKTVRPPNELLIPKVRLYRAYCDATGIKQAYPGTWLRGKRWLDDNTIPNNGQPKPFPSLPNHKHYSHSLGEFLLDGDTYRVVTAAIEPSDRTKELLQYANIHPELARLKELNNVKRA